MKQDNPGFFFTQFKNNPEKTIGMFPGGLNSIQNHKKCFSSIHDPVGNFSWSAMLMQGMYRKESTKSSQCSLMC